MFNLFPASVINTATVYIFSTDHCISVTGSHKVSVSDCPPQYRSPAILPPL
ncbi:unnamed protein product, partial [Staurois parvus]